MQGDFNSESVEPSSGAFRRRLRAFTYATRPEGKTECKAPKLVVESQTAGFVPNRSPSPTSSNGKTSAESTSRNTPTSTPKSLKRRHELEGVVEEQSPILAKRRSTAKERSANDPYEPVNNLVDVLQPGLTLVFVGLNPGLETGRTGHAYAHPTNLFWRLLHRSGITPVLHKPADTHSLSALYGIGNTNLCKRPTRSGADLKAQEQQEGAAIVEEKIAHFKPEAVCIVGKGIWDVFYKFKTGKPQKKDEFTWGWQDESLWLGRSTDENGEVLWKGARTFVTTSTSGLAASKKPAEKLEIWQPLGDWIVATRSEPGSPKV